jgi:glycosidase
MLDNAVFRPPHGAVRAEYEDPAATGSDSATPERLAFFLPRQAPGRHRVRVNARTADGRWAEEAAFCIDEGPESRLPADWSRQVIYFAMTDRFANGDRRNDNPVQDSRLDPKANHMGGDWAGIIRKIQEGYFRRLGVTTLWISPPNRNADGAWRDAVPPNRYYSSYHGYWPVAPRDTNPRHGTPGELKALVVTANRAGIKVIADFVANHVHQDHPYYREHRDWFGVYRLPDGGENLRKFDEHPLTTWFDTFLPDFDYDASPDALRAMTDDAVWWAREYGFDGYRHDATKHVSSAFWRSLTRALKTEVEEERGEPFFQVGESIVGRQKLMEYVGPGMLTGQFDFPLYWDIRAALASETAGMDQLDRSVHDSLRIYGPWAANPVFVGNHDFSRFMALADGWLKPDDEEKEFGWSHRVEVRDPSNYEKLKNAFTLVFTLPQVPMIYYGDEIGMAGAGDPDNRRMMRFGRAVTRPERAVAERVARLAALRRTHSSLREGDLTTLHADAETYAYLRSTFDERTIVAINRARTARTLEISLPAWCPPPDSLQPLLGTARARTKGGAAVIEIPPQSSAIFHLR